MPAERTRGSKRGDHHNRQLPSNSPDDPSSPMPPPAKTISFAPTVTPGTFFDPPEPVEPPPESLLFPPSPDVPATPPRRGGHTKKKPDDYIPRPPNAFILFRSSFIKNQHVSCEVETNHSTLSKIIGLTWQNLPHDEKQIWHSRAKVALQEHKKKFPEYAFRPAHTKGTKGAKGTGKRKVREVGPKDVKRCAKIAELLVEGKRGAELDAAIAEFDRSHVPEIVTRFEAPITARTYRRSSSVPVPPAPKPRKPRAASSQPAEPSPTGLSLDTWSKLPKNSDADASSEYSLDFSSIPPSPCESSADYAFPAADPVFDFSAFNFTAAASTPMPESVDPLSPGGHQDPQVYDPFVDYTQAPVAPNVASTDDVFGPNLSLTINTSYYGTPADSYSDSPSPASSMPTTPQTPHHLSYPMMYGSHAGISSPGLDYPSASPMPQYISPTPHYVSSPAPHYISSPVPQYTSASPVPGCSVSSPVPNYNSSSPVPDYSSSSPAPYYSASPAPYYDTSSPAPDYSPSYGYFPSISSYSENIAPTYAAASRTAEADPAYYTTPKSDFRYFDKPEVATYGSGLAPPFVPNYTM